MEKNKTIKATGDKDLWTLLEVQAKHFPVKESMNLTKKTMKKIIIFLCLLVSSFIFASCEMMLKNATQEAQEETSQEKGNSEVATAPQNLNLPQHHREDPTATVDSLAAIVISAIPPADSSAVRALDSLRMYAQATEFLLWLQWEVLQMHIMQSNQFQDSISGIYLDLRKLKKALSERRLEDAEKLLHGILHE